MSLWVFGYASLLWDPGFEVAQRQKARLHGYARSFCMYSIHHRGTSAQPGLVLALDAQKGAYCDGVALQVAPGHEAETRRYLQKRELVTDAYIETNVTAQLHDETQVSALAYVIDPTHAQYCCLPMHEQAQLIAKAHGGRGPNRDYLTSTARHLNDIGLPDPQLNALCAQVAALCDT